MKIPLKYGLLITLGVGIYVLIAHNLVTDPSSVLRTFGIPFVMNLLEFIMIYVGLQALAREKGDKPTFKEGLKTGVAISFVYAVTICLFFAGVIAVVGTKWLENEPGAAEAPMSRVAAGAFLGLFLGAMVFGLIYSTLISFFVAKRRSEE
ncbi:MAG TPA: hypothetical protein VFP64_06725 [Pyrinomonadaceae bacterium]|nr:hypothetical protein [Pyrinomonadaceae bacterium]